LSSRPWKEPSTLVLLVLFLAIQCAVWGGNGPGAIRASLPVLGYEYGNVAASLVSGHGFSNPFTYPTGPTAWMPPGPVLVYALVFFIFGIKTMASAYALATLKAAGLTAAVAVLMQTARAHGLQSRWLELVAMAAVAYFLRLRWLVQLDLDQWMVILLSCLLLCCLAQIGERLRPWHVVLAALLPLSSPALTVGFGIILLGRGAVARNRAALLLLLAMALAVSGWMVRNRVVMGHAYPVKSNLWFEVYLSNELAPHGLLSGETLIREHPYHAQNADRHGFRELGEARACELFRERSLEMIRREPGRMLGNVAARAYSIFIYGHHGNYFAPASRPMPLDDAKIVQDAHLIWYPKRRPNAQFWICLEWPPRQVQAALAALPLPHPALVWESWRRASLDRQADEARLPLRAVMLVYSLFPTLALLYGAVKGGFRDRLYLEILILYLAYFFPYALISHYERYQVSALGLQIWLMWLVLASGAWGSRLRRQEPLRE
jgi:hypothetical protein